MGRGDLDPKGVRLACPGCGATNRVPYGNLEKAARCARCKAPIPPPDEPIAVASSATFDAAIAQATLPILVDFWAAWCGPCRMIAPQLEKLAQERAGRALVLKVDTEGLPELAQRFSIHSIPTLALFAGGGETSRVAGAMSAAQIASWMDSAER
jgi:thioredoxin 2